jgi:hypothetical protein
MGVEWMNQETKKERKMKTNNIRSEFVAGFASVVTTTNDQVLAEELWGGFSRQLSDNELSKIESGGFTSGVEEGNKFNAMFPDSVPVSIDATNETNPGEYSTR